MGDIRDAEKEKTKQEEYEKRKATNEDTNISFNLFIIYCVIYKLINDLKAYTIYTHGSCWPVWFLFDFNIVVVFFRLPFARMISLNNVLVLQCWAIRQYRKWINDENEKEKKQETKTKNSSKEEKFQWKVVHRKTPRKFIIREKQHWGKWSTRENIVWSHLCRPDVASTQNQCSAQCLEHK